MEQLIFILVFGAIGLIKWLVEKSAEQRSRRETEERLDELDRSQSAPVALRPPIIRKIDSFPKPDLFPKPDVDARRLREALGLPRESELLLPRPADAPGPRAPTFRMEDVKVVSVADLEHRTVAPSLPPPLFRPASPPASAPAASSSLNELLHSRGGLRSAILMQEILGTSKGLVF